MPFAGEIGEWIAGGEGGQECGDIEEVEDAVVGEVCEARAKDRDRELAGEPVLAISASPTNCGLT